MENGKSAFTFVRSVAVKRADTAQTEKILHHQSLCEMIQDVKNSTENKKTSIFENLENFRKHRRAKTTEVPLIWPIDLRVPSP